ncbi:MAG: acyltransferase [Ferruginibacter sp.]
MKIIDRFRRVTSGQPLLAEVDGFRFLAILPVVLMHVFTALTRTLPGAKETVPSAVKEVIGTGETGVLIFFVISGFILALPFAKFYLQQGKPVNLKGYYLRRLTRLEPTYFITMLVFFLVHIVLHTDTGVSLVKHLLASLSYSHNIIYGKGSLINPVAWSLEVEIQFYILVPLLTRLFLIPSKNLRYGIYLLIMILGPFANGFFHLAHYNLQESIIKFLHYFMAGFFIADLYICGQREHRNVYLIDIVGGLSIVGIFLVEYLGGIKFFSAFAILLAFYAVLFGKRLRHFFSNPYISAIGGMCYTIYLVHYPLTYLVLKANTRIRTGNLAADYLINLAIFIPLILLICSILFLFIEKPFMYKDWPKRFTLYLANFSNDKKI